MACPASDLNEISSGDLPEEERNQTTKDNDSQKSAVKRSPSLSLKEIYEEFCSNTSIHGFQYFGQRRPKKEIGFWIIVFVITIYFCTTIIVKIYTKWCETPVIVSFSEKSTPIWNIPFPAVTICPETKRALKEKDKDYGHLLESLKTYVAAGENLSENYSLHELQETLTLMHICRFEIDQVYEIPKLSHKPFDYFETMDRMLPTMERYLLLCKWFGKFQNCQELFRKVYTDAGVCYTFNTLQAKDLFRHEVLPNQGAMPANKFPPLHWSLEEGYPEDNILLTYPSRVLSSGSESGLQIYLQSFPQELDFTCNGAVQGFKILLHSPDETPSVAKHFVRISGGKEILIAVKPKMITTSKDIAAYDPEKRRCFLSTDRQLRFYKIYNQDNCERECLTNFTYSQCGCVRFSMPHTQDMEICGEDKISCYHKAKDRLKLQQFAEGLQKSSVTSFSSADCNCLPGCTSLSYETEISEGSFDVQSTQKAFNVTELFKGQVSLVEIYFKENQFITSRRSELYGVSDLLANFGGVFGLFMGISILSIVELFYHCTLRLWSNMTLTSNVN
ncbi:pickpocket protein 28-like [Musca vetustissima]|uniref:pickpocket protein 28-like n=1 Tax=Musca vetustissima TaxID=27455 RepID=UPI002AB6673E|nr:pickpocket protein 28-like [Musca vetustissima]